MKQLLYYHASDGSGRGESINLCKGLPIQKGPFHVLPGKQVSYVKILSLPPVPKKKLRSMIRFQIQTIYPGDLTEICFDYISFRGKKEWLIVLYLLKKDIISAVCGNPKCRGIVLPLQLLPRKTLQTVSSLVVVYPDMAEEWKIEGGTPRSVKRLARKDFHPSDSPSDGERIIISQRTKKIVTASLKKGDIHRTFREAVRSSGLKQKYFTGLKKRKRDTLTPALTMTAFILSLFLLVHTLTEYTAIPKEMKPNTETVKSRQQQIHTLKKALKKREDNRPVNLYNVLYRIRKTIDNHTTITSFIFSGHDISLSCNSKHALETVQKIKKEFNTLHISGITPNQDGMEHYTIKLEVKR